MKFFGGSKRNSEKSAAEWADVAIEAGCRARVAIDNWDIKSANKAWQERQHAEARRKGYPGDDGFAGIDSEAIMLARVFQEPDTLGLPVERVKEVRTALAMGELLGATAEGGVLAALLGTPVPDWAEFNRERKHWADVGTHPDMWSDSLILEEPDETWQPPALASVSSDARQVLAYPGLVRRRMGVTRRLLARRTLLPEQRLESAVAELTTAGFAAAPTTADRLSSLTVEQLKAFLGDLGLVGRGIKASLVKAFDPMSEDVLLEYLTANHPEALEVEWTLGLGADRRSGWHIEYAALMSNWLGSSLATAAQKATWGSKHPHILRTDRCPACLHPSKPLPPFHIGCRCAWVASL